MWVNRTDLPILASTALFLMLGACSADLGLNNVTLASKPETQLRKPDWTAPSGGRSNLEPRPLTADLVGPEGQCSAGETESAQPTASADPTQGAPPVVGGIALQMTECEVVRRAGPVDKIDFGVNERGERSVVLTYRRGPWPGIYRFAGGRLVSMERVPDPPPAPEKPHKASPLAKKKPAGT